MTYDSYVIALDEDGEERFVCKGYATVSAPELARHFSTRKTARKYLGRYNYNSPEIKLILGREAYEETY